jgi:hypothetical protein
MDRGRHFGARERDHRRVAEQRPIGPTSPAASRCDGQHAFTWRRAPRDRSEPAGLTGVRPDELPVAPAGLRARVVTAQNVHKAHYIGRYADTVARARQRRRSLAAVAHHDPPRARDLVVGFVGPVLVALGFIVATVEQIPEDGRTSAAPYVLWALGFVVMAARAIRRLFDR